MMSTQQLRKEIFRLERYIIQLRKKGENTDMLEMDLESAKRMLPENIRTQGRITEN